MTVLREKEITRGQSLKTDKPVSEPINKQDKALLYGYDNMARSIQSFMYEGRPGRSKLKNHSPEEYQKFLENLVQRCWDNYNNGVSSLMGKKN